jgi:hypothetical protein
MHAQQQRYISSCYAKHALLLCLTPAELLCQRTCTLILLLVIERFAYSPLSCCCRDALRFVDAEEAEAVYSMVALTQARGPAWPQQQQQQSPAGVAEVSCRRALWLRIALDNIRLWI